MNIPLKLFYRKLLTNWFDIAFYCSVYHLQQFHLQFQLHDIHPEVALYSGCVFVWVPWGNCGRLDKVYVG